MAKQKRRSYKDLTIIINMKTIVIKESIAFKSPRFSKERTLLN